MRFTKSPLAATLGFGLFLLFPLAFLRSDTNDFQLRVVTTDPIVGTWSCAIPPAGGAPAFTVIKSIHAGGTESEIDNAAPPNLESPTVGTWSPRPSPQDRGITLNYWQDAYQMTWDPSGNFTGTFHYFGPMTLDPSLKALNIKGTATLIGPASTVVTSFPFTAHCTRP